MFMFKKFQIAIPCAVIALTGRSEDNASNANEISSPSSSSQQAETTHNKSANDQCGKVANKKN